MYVYHTISRDIVLPSLNLSLGYVLIPDVLVGIGSPLIMATGFEFISAQSPSSMKGLLVGVFFSMRAFFQLIIGVSLIPFSYRPIWNSQHIKEHPPVANCGKNREQDDRPVANCGFGYLS